jgi:DNA polymerase III alpha subunit
MRTDKYGQVILDKDEVFAGLYSGKISSLTNLLIENPELVKEFNQALRSNYDHIPQIKEYVDPNITVEEFDKLNQNQWYMPDEYKTYDIVDWLYCECHTIEQKERVTQELTLFAQHNMIDLLKYIKYLVDTMREHKIVWGVGRGSSVASYVLFLIGVHKIDSIKYELNIEEFLR